MTYMYEMDLDTPFGGAAPERKTFDTGSTFKFADPVRGNQSQKKDVDIAALLKQLQPGQGESPETTMDSDIMSMLGEL